MNWGEQKVPGFWPIPKSWNDRQQGRCSHTSLKWGVKDHNSSGFSVIEASEIAILTKKNHDIIVGQNGDLCLDDGDDLSDSGVNGWTPNLLITIYYDTQYFATMNGADDFW